MKANILLCICILLSCKTKQNSSQAKIVNGERLSEKHQSYATASTSAVAITDPSGYDVICSGVLVSKNIVLTAAHCLLKEDTEDKTIKTISDFKVAFTNEIPRQISISEIQYSENVDQQPILVLSNNIKKEIGAEIEIGSSISKRPICKGIIVEENKIKPICDKLNFNEFNSEELIVYWQSEEYKENLYSIKEFQPNLKREQVNKFTQTSNNDYIFFVLEKNAPKDYFPVTIYSDELIFKTKFNIDLVGFGFQTEMGVGDGEKRIVTVPFDQYFNNQQFNGLFTYRSLDKKGACRKDSGGPAYIYKDDIWYLIGITHGASIVKNDSSDCESGVGTYTFIGVHKKEIEKLFTNNEITFYP